MRLPSWPLCLLGALLRAMALPRLPMEPLLQLGQHTDDALDKCTLYILRMARLGCRADSSVWWTVDTCRTGANACAHRA